MRLSRKKSNCPRIHIHIFAFGGNSTSDVPFCFVCIQKFLCLGGKLRIYSSKSFANVFVNRAFGNAEFFCGTSHGGAMLNHIPADCNCSFGYVILHCKSVLPAQEFLTSQNSVLVKYMCRNQKLCLLKKIN